MPILNRDNATSEQRAELGGQINSAVTGASYFIGIIAYPCVFEAATIAAAGLSGAPQYMLNVSRMVAGSGVTVFALGISNLIALEQGLSGPVEWAGVRTAGSTLLILQKDDLITVSSSVANTAALQVNVAFVVRKTQDIVQHFSLTT